jgi:hypothetical protein
MKKKLDPYRINQNTNLMQNENKTDWKNFDRMSSGKKRGSVLQGFTKDVLKSKRNSAVNNKVCIRAESYSKSGKNNQFSIGENRAKFGFQDVNVYNKENVSPEAEHKNYSLNVEPLVEKLYQESGISHKKVDSLYPAMVIDTPYNRSISGIHSLKNRKSQNLKQASVDPQLASKTSTNVNLENTQFSQPLS